MRYTHIAKARIVNQAEQLLPEMLEKLLLQHNISSEEFTTWKSKIQTGGATALKFTSHDVPQKHRVNSTVGENSNAEGI